MGTMNWLNLPMNVISHLETKLDTSFIVNFELKVENNIFICNLIIQVFAI